MLPPGAEYAGGVTRNPDPNSGAIAPTATLLWAAAIIAVFAPLANARYRRSASR